MGIASEVVELVQLIIKLAKEGLSEEEIAKRLSDPNGVGADLLQKAAERRKLGEDYLGRKRD